MIILECWNWSDVVMGKLVSNLNIYKTAAIYRFFHNGLCWCSVSPSPHHFVFGSVSTSKYDDVLTLKTFMCGHSCMMTFLHLKVYNGWGIFFVGLVFQIFLWFSISLPHQVWFQHLCMATVKTFMSGHLCVMTFLYFIKNAKRNPPK